MHLLLLHKLIAEFNPQTVIIDPISSLITVGTRNDVKAMLIRLMDMLKVNQINGLFTALTHEGGGESDDFIVDAVSSLADTWIKVKNQEQNGSRVRSMLIIKARGMGHSNSRQDFLISDRGIQLIPNLANEHDKIDHVKVPVIKRERILTA